MKAVLSNSVQDGWDLVREDKTGAITSTTKYLVPEGEVLAFERDGEMFYLHGDALSSTQLITDENGDQVARFVYGAWGEELHATDNVPGGTECRFVGGLGVRTDPVTGLIYMRHRWYSVEEQRFISRDPIGLMGDTNLYRYSNNNPVTYTDHTGLKSLWPVVSAFGWGAVKGAVGTVMVAGLLAFGGSLGLAVVATAAVASGGIYIADAVRRVWTGQDWTREELAGMGGELLGGGIALKGLTGGFHTGGSGFSRRSRQRGMLNIGKGDPCKTFRNQLPGSLADEISLAASVGAKKIRPGTSDFASAVNEGTIKWVVTESGDLVVSLHTIQGQEISHAFLSNGGPVRSAGQADIAFANGAYFGIGISNHSGHFKPSQASVVKYGIPAFRKYGVNF